MTYAPHSNSDVDHQHKCGVHILPLLLGSFRFDNAKGAFFEYGERSAAAFPADFAADLPHQLYTIDGPRLCRVLKTVAVVCVDEAADGSPVTERWPLACHRFYPTDWVSPLVKREA